MAAPKESTAPASREAEADATPREASPVRMPSPEENEMAELVEAMVLNRRRRSKRRIG
jgi:hypothetical protein